MISDLEHIFSNLVKRSKRSAIREILKLTQQPDIISFAGGLPAPDSFPVEEIKAISNKILEDEGASALQYDASEGVRELRETLVDRYREAGIGCSLENLIITTGSQQALDLLGKVFINPGDRIICGLPSYVGGLGAFAAYGARLNGIPLDRYGMSAEGLHETLEEMRQQGEKPKFIYVIPDFQNPAGITMPESRRIEIISLAREYDVLIVEDAPYRELRFEGESQAQMYEMEPDGGVITLGTFSKIVAPGFRVGWILANPAINDKLVVAKQSADACTPTLLQMIAARYLKTDHYRENLQKTISLYRRRRDLMLDGFRKYMPKEVHWTEPEGGLFLFLTLPAYLDAEQLLRRAIEKRVAFVIGNAFFSNGEGKNTMRLNFSFVNEEQNILGVEILASVIKEAINSYQEELNMDLKNA
ncbi:MAG: PLP-dependent aminotransferase family protein [Bacteroidota bacterium]